MSSNVTPLKAAADPPSVTEDAVALEFARRHADHLRFDHDAGAWFVFDGSIWRRDRKRLAFHYAREEVRRLGEAEKIRRQTSNAAFAGGVEKFAQRDPALAVTSDHWDRDAMLLGTPSGTVELRTSQLRGARAADAITRSTACAPAREAACPRWRAFLTEATGDDADLMEFLQRFAGYCLSGSTREHALLFIYGPGGNGKSVFLNTVSGILGTYATTAPMESFSASIGDRHPADIAMLAGARLVTASETERGRMWAESRIKLLTGGDPITARFMRRDFFTFVPAFKMVIAGNHKPTLRGLDDALRRRINIVPFTRKPIAPNPDLEAELREEWPAILRWMIQGALAWQSQGLVRPQAILDATRDYFAAQDPMGHFLEDACDCEPGNEHKRVSASEIFEAWSRYARAAGEEVTSQRLFGDELEKRGFPRGRRSSIGRFHSGLRLKRGLEEAGR